ncbi:MAG: DNA-deoxyinosine glycosylase [Eubacteriales bacterium]
MKNYEKINCNPPIIDSTSKILILGSMPSVKSIEKREYYANPLNRFWKVIFSLFDEELTLDYDKKIDFLHKNHIALFDVINSCLRNGSLDLNIREYELNDILGLLKSYPAISLIVLNGSTAAKLFEKNFKDKVSIPYIKLPSTSPIPRKDIRNFKDLYNRWIVLKNYIKKQAN